MSKIDLVGKVIQHGLRGFLVLEELEDSYNGFWVSGYSRAKPEELTHAQVGESRVLANSLEEFIVTKSKKAADAAGVAKYLDTVCLNGNSTLGIVTSYEGGIAHGVTFDGADWHARHPVIQARHLNDYFNQKILKAVEKV
jgi:hypothetical protein